MSATLLLVEDDPNLGAGLEKRLRDEGFAVIRAGRLSDAEREFRARAFDLVLLDWMLPDGQGIDFLRKLRIEGVRTPILLLTARSEVVDRVLGLEMGANDYLPKPFDPRELVARIRVQLRQPEATPVPGRVLAVGGIRLDLEKRAATLDGRAVELTKMEFELLRLFIEHPDRVFSREELLNQVWGYNQFPTTRTVDTHLVQLRQKFGDDRFETIRGVGYRLKS
ncbi:MAG: response regulator transcription factor [Bdellovibrionales bacterium]|nr:response regulator transcription factor [Bdellovibrionales bacterium]